MHNCEREGRGRGPGGHHPLYDLQGVMGLITADKKVGAGKGGLDKNIEIETDSRTPIKLTIQHPYI